MIIWIVPVLTALSDPSPVTFAVESTASTTGCHLGKRRVGRGRLADRVPSGRRGSITRLHGRARLLDLGLGLQGRRSPTTAVDSGGSAPGHVVQSHIAAMRSVVEIVGNFVVEIGRRFTVELVSGGFAGCEVGRSHAGLFEAEERSDLGDVARDG